jgi:hypothetical protein
MLITLYGKKKRTLKDLVIDINDINTEKNKHLSPGIYQEDTTMYAVLYCNDYYYFVTKEKNKLILKRKSQWLNCRTYE